MGDIPGLLHITPMESMGNEKGRLYCAHGIFRQFMTEIVVSFSSSQHESYTPEKKYIRSEKLEEKIDETRGNITRKRKKASKYWLDQRLKSEASQHQTLISGPKAIPQRQWA